MKTFEQYHNQEKQINEELVSIAVAGILSAVTYKLFKKYVPKMVSDISDGMVQSKTDLLELLDKIQKQATNVIKDTEQLGDVMLAIKVARTLVNKGDISTSGELENFIKKMYK